MEKSQLNLTKGAKHLGIIFLIDSLVHALDAATDCHIFSLSYYHTHSYSVMQAAKLILKDLRIIIS